MTVDYGGGNPFTLAGAGQVVQQRRLIGAIGKIETAGILPLGPEQVRRDRYAGMAGSPVVLFDCVHRVRHKFGNGNFPVGDTVDKGHVGAVFQQPAHQVGQQVFVRAHRRIDATGNIEALRIGNVGIQFLAHAVQPLEFELPAGRMMIDIAHGVGIMGGELRIYAGAMGQQVTGAGQVG